MLFSETRARRKVVIELRRGVFGAFGVAGNRLCLDQQFKQALTRTTLGFTACPYCETLQCFLVAFTLE